MSIFNGVGVAMITPFNDGGVDLAAMGKLIDFLIDGGADALCVAGTTGEPATMTAKEKRTSIEFTIDRAKGKLPVVVGCGCNCTADTVTNAIEAEKLGADALLVVTPYYNKCTQNGLVAHYSAVSDAVRVPIIAYNVPGRTGVNILPETGARLADVKNVVAVKEASGNVSQLQELIRLTEGKLDVYLGEDALTYVGMTLGAKGVISVAANVAPKEMTVITDCAGNGDYASAREMQFRLAPLIADLFSEVNPIPVKYALALMGIGNGMPRLPLTPMEEAHATKLAASMRALGIID